MKKTYLIVLAVAALVSCTKGYQDKRPDPSREDAVSFAGSTLDDDRTRVSYREDAGAIRLAWKTTDKIGIYALCNDAPIAGNTPYKALQAASTSLLDAVSESDFVEWQDETLPHDFYAYYPYRQNAGNSLNAVAVSLPDTQTQSGGGSMAHISEYDFMYASFEDAVKTGNAIRLPFDHLFSVMAVQLTAREGTMAQVSSITFRCTDPDEAVAFGGTFDLAAKALTVAPATKSNSVTLTFSSPLSVRQAPVNAYILISSGHKGKTFEITATVNGVETGVLWTKPVPGDGIPAGVKTTIPVTVEGTPVDPNAVTDLSAGGTANTYLVNAAATNYKFKATVKGNGVARNYEWTNDGHPLSGGYSDADLVVAPKKAALVWYNSPKSASGWVKDSPVDISSVELRDDGYVYFSTPGTFVPGNVLLAVFDDNDEVLWSWNIWAVEGYNYETSAKPLGAYTIMDRNLGAIKGKEVKDNPDPREAAWAIGNYYQWGRKDPFPAVSDYTDYNLAFGLPTYTPIDKLKQDCSSQSWGSDDMMFSNDLAANAYPLATHLGGTSYTIEQAVEASVKYPYRWMSNSTSNISASPYLWMVRNENQPNSKKAAWRYLWGNVEGTGGQKSIYDPCPPGWKVPDAAAMSLANSFVDYSSNEYGLYSSVYDLYLPLAGQHTAGSSAIGNLGKKGNMYMWTSSSSYFLDSPLRSGGTDFRLAWDSYGSAGYQMRCVKEEPRTPVIPGGSLTTTRGLLMGDSITEVWEGRSKGANGEPSGPVFFQTNGFVSKGISGHTTYNMLMRFCNDAIKYDPSCLVITAGTNDIADMARFHLPVEDIFANIRIMAEWASAYGSEIVIGSTPPMNNVYWLDEAWNAANKPADSVIALNKLLKAYAEERGFGYIDYHTALKDENNGLKYEYTWGGQEGTNDRLHPSSLGYSVMQPLLKAAVDKALRVEGQVDSGSDQLKDLDKWEEWGD